MIYSRATIINIIPLLFFITFLQSASCNKNDTKPCRNAPYGFNITSEWSPEKNIYYINDSLFLVCSFSTSLIDINSNSLVNYSNSKKIGGNLAVYYLDTVTNKLVNAIDSFSFSAISGFFDSNPQAADYKKSFYFLESQNLYSLKIKLTCKAKGIYAIFVSNPGSQGIVGEDCTNAGFYNKLTNLNQHINLFESALNQQLESQFERERIYCFRVN